MRRTLIAAILMGLTSAVAGATVTAKLGAGSKLWIEGDSTLHKWASDATKLDASLTMDGAALASGLSAQAPAKLTLDVPVKEMRNRERSGAMDKNVQKALKADKYPDIVFDMSAYKLDAAAGTISATGQLSIAGVTKPQTVVAKYVQKAGRIILDGEQPLLMTDFGVKPPTAMFGTIKADDRVVVKFHVELEPGAGAAKTGR